MSALSIKYLTYIRFLLLISLTVLIGFKTVAVVKSISSIIKKEVLATEYGNDTEKKSEKTDTEKEKEFALINECNIGVTDIKDVVIHKTIYSDQYQSANFANISIPPPDTFTILPLV